MKKIKEWFKNYHPSKFVCYLFLALPIIFASIQCFGKLDNDSWFLLNTGRYIINHGFPSIDPFTIHEGFELVVQQWLTDVIFYEVFDLFGKVGVAFLVFAIYLIIIYIFYKLCQLLDENRFRLSVLLTVIFGVLYARFFLTSRPQIFDCLIFLIEFYLLESFINKKNTKYLIGLPILSLALINFHSSSWFLFLIFLIPYYLKLDWFHLEKGKYSLKPLVVATIVSILVAFINPYGWDAISYIFYSYGDYYINKLVAEMRQIQIFSFWGIALYGTVLLVSLCYLLNRNKKMKTRFLLLYLGTSILAFSSWKGFQFFLISSIFPLADFLKDNFKKENKEVLYSKLFWIRYAAIWILFASIPILNIVYTTVDEEPLKVLKDTILEREDTPELLRVYTGYNAGGYFEFYDMKTYLDARAEVFIKKFNGQKDVLKEWNDLQNGRMKVEEFMDMYNFDYYVVEEDDYLYQMVFKDNENYEMLAKTTWKDEEVYLYRIGSEKES